MDRFAAAATTLDPSRSRLPVFCGGTLDGVTRRLDYLRGLGVNTLWLSPVTASAAYHGYHVLAYDRVEPRFGGERAWDALMRAARPDFRILLDWVPNHIHREHPFFQQAIADPHSPYREWFHFGRDGRPLCFLHFDELPKLNLDHPDVRSYLLGECKRWLDRGVDGFRMDHVVGPSMDFWRTFRADLKAHRPGVFLMGEATLMGVRREHLVTLRLPDKRRYFFEAQLGHDITDAVQAEYATVFDGVLDFGFRNLLCQRVARRAGPVNPGEVQAALDAHYARFEWDACLPSFLDNHDVNRFLHEAKGRVDRLLEAAALQFLQPQPPVIYYGTELGLSHAHPVAGPYGDLHARPAMPWTGLNQEPGRSIRQRFQELIAGWKRAFSRAPGDSLIK
ncbi:MAG TPA: alpha-amylase family glycosyl hydrolase [Verrucomicrobiota bacterium]|nr:alpha-amylase family glycosyl hydrolase [Verrucomicrobiota bacterium]HRZ37512.1 alpha-amylase family glycosyl hydrolase [Candidatus Paceibacterota bacterium]HRZ53869.1 alpha-amylase family glycosyl hydrolase [Candidatus Paceibacterota bacterium]